MKLFELSTVQIANKSLMSNVARFSDLLKRNGIPLALGEVLDAANALTAVPIFDKSVFYFALRSALVKDPNLYDLYDNKFREFWSADLSGLERKPPPFSKPRSEKQVGIPQLIFTEPTQEDQFSEKATPKSVAIYSPASRNSQRNFKPQHSLEKIRRARRLVKRFKRRFATMHGRRIVESSAGKIDLGRSMRKSVSSGGSTIILTRSEKKITRSKIIALADVSGSMDEQSEDIYLLFYSLKNISPRTELFIFSTELVRLTSLFSFNNFHKIAESISKRVQIWGSGTRIGECFEDFLKRYGSLIDKDTTVLIISDGWDLGDPKILNEAMYLMKSKSSRIIWLNPHAKTEGYESTCLGMKTALPYIDVLTSPDVFTSRQSFERYFGRATSPLPKSSVRVNTGSNRR